MINFREFLDKSKTKEKTLYVSRPLLNAKEVRKWAKKYLKCKLLEADDMHVTIAFSREKVDWKTFKPKKDKLKIKVDQLAPSRLGDKGAVVLKFKSDELQERWKEFKDGGCSWDYPSYQPHVTMTYDYKGSDSNLNDVDTFSGEFIFGPEKFTEVVEDWDETITEK